MSHEFYDKHVLNDITTGFMIAKLYSEIIKWLMLNKKHFYTSFRSYISTLIQSTVL